MCGGTITTMACKHELLHFKTRCGAKCARPSGPGTVLRYLNDTCAECDSPHNLSAARRGYDERVKDLVRHADAARSEGRFEDEQVALGQIALLEMRFRSLYAEDLKRRRQTNLGDNDVSWPSDHYGEIKT